ncbi:hypothetical protein [Brevibacterium luteolum]|uniref:Uncharacterized protein n=1 Tax=Brevibacterium luteolum TaxID=199591 RepID=A0A2N6PH97_9MICO|nr:hypothetical protein [Brevibacterium luteolum]PMB98064.1 hypothetical protein CJ198_06705 [Brevibacterium luteolum]
MIFDILDIFDDLPAFGSSPRHRGERRNLMARWTLGLALAGIITVGLPSSSPSSSGRSVPERCVPIR